MSAGPQSAEQTVVESLATYSPEAMRAAIEAARDPEVAAALLRHLEELTDADPVEDFTPVGLCVALGRPDWATDPALSTADGRRQHHDRIDEQLSAWCEERRGDDIVAALWSHGVPVAKVMQPHRQSELPQPSACAGFSKMSTIR